MTAREVLGHDLVELLGVLGRAQVAVVGDCVLGQARKLVFVVRVRIVMMVMMTMMVMMVTMMIVMMMLRVTEITRLSVALPT